MDYDRTTIPEAYDRARDHGPVVLALWMDAIESRIANKRPATILDLGCGTGRFSQALASHFDADVIGVDPSAKMLEQARGKPHDRRVRYEHGAAEAIPRPFRSVDLVFTSMTFHHFAEPPTAARECRRVLRDGGSVFVRTASREQIDTYPYVPFFPSSRPLLVETLPSLARIREVFEAAGLRLSASDLIRQTIAPDWSVYADKLEAGGDSILARLSERDMSDGLARVRRHAAEIGPEPVDELIDVLVFQ